MDDATRDWLTLGAASRLLGVNESTLRRWADAGAVRTFRTPGGHRRFSQADLHRLTAAAQARPHEFDGEALGHIRSRLAGEGDGPGVWLEQMPADVRHALGALGRELVGLAESAAEPEAGASAAAAAAEAAAALGERYAVLLRRSGVRLADAISAFAFFRRGMDEAVGAFAARRRLSAAEAAGRWAHVSAVEDRLLVALTAAYEGPPRDAVAPSLPLGGRRDEVPR